MGNIGLLKRALPFFGTFALGLFVASFFVNIGPRFEYRNYERGRWRHELRELREENMRLKYELDSVHEKMDLNDIESEDWVPPSVDEPVLAPPPPRPVKPHSVHAK